MTTVGLGQQGSQAVGSGFESLPCQSFLRFIPNSFRYPKLMKQKVVLLRNFSALWDQKFSTESLDALPPLINKLFRYRKVSETQHKRVPRRNFSALWDKNFLTETLDTPFLIQALSIPEIIETLKDSPLRKFSELWDKKISTESLVTAPPSYSWYFSLREFFWNSTERFLYEIFQHCETTKFLTEYRDTPSSPSYPNFFDTRN